MREANLGRERCPSDHRDPRAGYDGAGYNPGRPIAHVSRLVDENVAQDGDRGGFEYLDDVAAVVAAGPDPEKLDVGRLSLETHADVEEVYDRVFDAHDLGGLVSEVIRRVALRGDDAKAYADHRSQAATQLTGVRELLASPSD